MFFSLYQDCYFLQAKLKDIDTLNKKNREILIESDKKDDDVREIKSNIKLRFSVLVYIFDCARFCSKKAGKTESEKRRVGNKAGQGAS